MTLDHNLRTLLPAVFIFLGCLLLWFFISRLRRCDREQRALEKPFPREWVEILQRNLPPYGKISNSFQKELHQKINLFLDEKSFEGCGGLVITDEIRVTIAAQACLLLLNRKIRCYPRLRSVVVYPDTFVVGGKGMLTSDESDLSARLGESWGVGTVVLSWNHVKRGASNFSDGHNVTLHEFAHQLDQEDGPADGAPVLEQRSAYYSWAKVLSGEFDVLQEKVKRGKNSVLDDYGATNPAEFFAVATETFYEKPSQLRSKHPELYRELQEYYKVNPAEWICS